MGSEDAPKAARFGTHAGARTWLNMDPCGAICSAITWAIVLFAMRVVSTVIIFPWLSESMWGALHWTAFNSIGVLALVCHVRAMMTNPGAVPPDAAPLSSAEERPRTCRRCENYKPRRAHHCSICERCILKMDHHCPWVNNCVGLGNHKYFLLFLLYVNATCGYALVLIVARFYGCLGTRSGCGGTTVNVILVIVFAILFGLFTLCMMCDQYSVLSTNLTKIDRLKSAAGTANGASDGGARGAPASAVNEVFGGTKPGFQLSWLLPTAPRYPPSMRRPMLGYRVQMDIEVPEWAGSADKKSAEEAEPMLGVV